MSDDRATPAPASSEAGAAARVLTRDEAIEFAVRIARAIDAPSTNLLQQGLSKRTDRKRVACDLKGYLRALEGLADCEDACWRCDKDSDAHVADHTRRYTEERDDCLAGLTETGALYGEKL